MLSWVGFFFPKREGKPTAAEAGSDVARRSASVAPAMDLEWKIMICSSLWRPRGPLTKNLSVLVKRVLMKRLTGEKNEQQPSELPRGDGHTCYPAI
jgi:hypothetical protein